MRVPLPSPPDLLSLAASGLPPAGDFPIRSSDPDPGLFGPASVTWEVMREPLLLLGASRALLTQVAHPLVAQGALDHSDFSTDPLGRFQRTVAWVTAVVFGTRAEALAACREVNRRHRPVEGTLPSGSATHSWSPGSAYRARDRELVLWVHCCLVDSMLVTHDSLIGSLRVWQRNRFVREWDMVARLMGLAPGSTWSSAAQMGDWFRSRLGSGQVAPGPGSRQVARAILDPEAGLLGSRTLSRFSGLVTAGLLPEPMRRGYGIPWTHAHALAFQGLRAWLRTSKGLLPRSLRVSPVYDFACARAAGELDRQPALREALIRRPRLA